MRRWLVLAIAGCTTSVDAPPVALRVEPASLDLQVVLGAAPPAAAIHVYATSLGGEREVTNDATFTLAGPALGSVVDGQFSSDGLTGGAATIAVAYGDASTTIPIVTNVYERRVVDGAPAGLADTFAAATSIAGDAGMSPADGCVLPPDLGALALDFTAADTDDAEEARIVAPYLDIAIDAAGSAGPREVALTAAEWQAIARTALGGSIDVTVASLQTTAPATAHVASASYGVAELPASSILVGVLVGSAPPAFERYDTPTASLEPMLVGPNGACVGCHIAISADGSRIAAGVASANGGPAGILFDGHSGAILATSDASPSPWVAAAFDPSGAMIGANEGVLALRDGTTAAVMAPIVTGELATSPTVSPDGSLLAYAEVDAGSDTNDDPLGDALHVRSWNAATAAVGPPTELVRDGRGVVMPAFSPDGRWIAYGHTANPSSEEPTGAAAVRADGTGTIVELTSDPADGLARWASPIAATRVADRDAEPMVWIAFASERAVASAPAGTRQLWLEAFFPDRGVIAPAFHLAGQGSAEMLHGPLALQ
jgi:hypothetical protein